MAITEIAPGFAIAPQVTEADVANAAAAGFRTIICNRPDAEEPGQPDAQRIRAAAEAQGMCFVHIPVVPGQFSTRDLCLMRDALQASPLPILAYCRSGARAKSLREQALALTQDGRRTGTACDVLIIGGGSAGIACAASLLKRQPDLSINVVEPADQHYYQPGWTLVGAGVFSPRFTRHAMADVMPSSVTWIKRAAAGFEPEHSTLVLDDGSRLRYRVLIAAPGLKLDWNAIAGLPESLGRNGVTSNYRFDLAPYTRELAGALTRGKALFTQPAMPIKCAGAPQKAMYLSCDMWRRAGRLSDIHVEFHTAAAALFGVAHYVPSLMNYVERYRIGLRFQSNLVAVDADARMAGFESRSTEGETIRSDVRFDMLHVVPPQVAPDFVRHSPLADSSGFIAVDPNTLRHVRYANIYALGDAANTPNAKTAAAARKQAPVVAVNALATLDGREPEAGYDGYGSCPLTVERGKIVLAEFGYGGKLLPSFPSWLLDGSKATRRAWFLKDRVLPSIYWHGMLKGREWLAKPTPLARDP